MNSRRRRHARPSAAGPEQQAEGPLVKRILLAGASGRLGTAIAVELKRRGYWIRALTRNPEGLHAEVDEVFVGDLIAPRTLKGVCSGIRQVFSCAGAPASFGPRGMSRYSFRQIDDIGNRNLLISADEAGVRRFGYLSVYGGRLFGSIEFIRAHESFATALRSSDVNHVVIRATPTFATFAPLLRKARKGKITVLAGGSASVNPIHEEELAEFCVDAMESRDHDLEVGGPVTYTRAEIAGLALDAWGRHDLVRNTSWTKTVLLHRLTRLRGKHNLHISQYQLVMAINDVIAPAHGTRTLGDYFAELVAAESDAG